MILAWRKGSRRNGLLPMDGTIRQRRLSLNSHPVIGEIKKGRNTMASNSPTLQERRQNAIQAVERLLRVTTDYEDEDWTESYRLLLDALRAERDEDAIDLGKTIESETPEDPSSGFRLQPRWVVSEGLAEDVRRTLTRLRTH